MITNADRTADLASLNDIELASYLSISSRSLATSLRATAWRHLAAGCVVAAIGLIYFYFFAGFEGLISKGGRRVMDRADIFIIIRSVGVLIAIEYVALFFLKQYRASMDDFRYFQKVQRRREELVLAMRINVDRAGAESMLELVKNGTVFSSLQEKDEIASREWKKFEAHELDAVTRLIQAFIAKADGK